MAESTTIAADTSVTGRLEGDEDLTVRGYVDGSVELSETLTIARGGRVDGEIRARDVVVEGVFQGEIVAEQRVVLAATARAVADIEAPVVEMADGAELRGQLSAGAAEGIEVSTETSRSGRERSSGVERTPSRSPRPATSTAGSTERTRSAESTGDRTRETATSTTTTVTETEESAESADESEDESEEEAEEFSVSEEALEEYREDFTVKELREKLRNYDLRVSGTKDELIERLVRHEQTD